MWLIDTHTAELRFFAGPDDVPGGYAILSHVWGIPEEEDTFQKVRNAYEECQQVQGRASGKSTAQDLLNERQDSFIAALSARVLELEVKMLNLQIRERYFATTEQRSGPDVAALNDTTRSTCAPEYTPIDHTPRTMGPVAPLYYNTWNSLPETFYRTQNRKAPSLDSGIATLYTSQYAPGSTTPHKAPAPPLHFNARNRLSDKIRRFLIQADRHGYKWAWADTCCIDKTSSAELTEAINSMFHYYSCSDVCYAYLKDVPACEDVREHYWPFARSRWHQRGYTLQELLAPKIVIFMADDWTPLGTKYELADVLEKHIDNMPPASVLRFEKDISEMSVAQRMSWAARRSTTRVEDEAYCLFGLFGINMPTLYGEGRNAFYRLQEAIMTASPDTSLFAWSGSGWFLDDDVLGCRVDDVKGGTPNILGWLPADPTNLEPVSHLLAPSPHEFKYSGRIISSIVRDAQHVALPVSCAIVTSGTMPFTQSPYCMWP